MKRPSRIGEQLELELLGVGRAWREPWGGRSPRGLTKAVETFSVSRIPPGGPRPDADYRDLPTEGEGPNEQLGLPFFQEI